MTGLKPSSYKLSLLRVTDERRLGCYHPSTPFPPFRSTREYATGNKQDGMNMPKTVDGIKPCPFPPCQGLPKGSISPILRCMQRLRGSALAAEIRSEVAKQIKKAGIKPRLAVLLVGDDAASHVYVSLKEQAAKEIGIETDIRRVPAQTPDAMLLGLIAEWNQDPRVHGILIQLPLPVGHDTQALIEAMDPHKDVDGFHPEAVKALLQGQAPILPPVHEGILRLIAASGAKINGARIALITNSDIFSTPLEYLLKKAGALVDAMKATEFDPQVSQQADIVIVAVGRRNFLDRSAVKSGAIIIDVGTNRLDTGRVVGDVDTQSVSNLEGWLTPVPGGVGPMTIAVLLKNVTTLATQPSLHPIRMSPSNDA